MLILNLFFILFFLTLSYVVFYGWGFAFAHSLFKFTKKFYFSSYVLLGIIFITFLTEIVHIFFRIDWKISIFCYLAGLAFGFKQINFLKTKCKNFFLWIKLNSFLFFLFTYVIIYWTLRITKLPTNYDTAAYHLQTIRWINSFPLVPGLANLDTHIAFNQSYFELLSIFRFFPFFPYGYSIGAILFFFLFGVFIFERLNTKYIYISVFASLMYLVNHSAGSTLFSPTPDLIVSILEIIVFSMYVDLLSMRNLIHKRDELIFLIILISGFLFTVKLTAVFFACGIFLLTLVCIFPLLNSYKKSLYGASIFSLLFSGIHLYSGYILSGFPFFPLSIGGMDYLPWSLPKEILFSDVNSIYSASKQTVGSSNANLGFFEWVPRWFFAQEKTFRFFLICTLFLLLANFFGFFLKKIKFEKDIFFLLLLCIFSIFVWLITAPDIRYLGSIFEILFVMLFVLFLKIFNFFHIYNFVKTYIFKLSFFTIIVFSSFALNRNLFSGWDPLPNISSEVFFLDSSIKINLSSELCWDSEIPCLNKLNKSLKLIKKGNIESGFTLKH